MANRHFGKLGDVWKHLPLAEILSTRAPQHYWETHAGSASYQMVDDSTRKHGVLRFLEHAPLDRDLADSAYLRILQSMPGVYPGSALLAAHCLGARARYLLCDLDPDSAATLESALQRFESSVLRSDGIAAVQNEMRRTKLNPTEVIVHIDPFSPHERLTPDSVNSVEVAAELAREGYRVFYWYGYEDVALRGWARDEIIELAPGSDLWCGEVTLPSPFVYPQREGLWACGIVLANATSEEKRECERLGRSLDRICAGDVLDGNDPPALRFAVI